MTLSLDQRDKIYEGIPTVFDNGNLVLQKSKTRQFIKAHQPDEYPLLLVTFVSEGIPVTMVRELKSDLDPSTRIKTTTYGQICKARVSALIESPDLRQIESLAGLFSRELCSTELQINPIDDRMQFRGADPPQFPEPYETFLVLDGKKGLAKIHRCAIDFFVEYEFSWTKQFDTMQEFEAEVDGPPEPIKFMAYGNGTIFTNYSIDVILSR